MFSALFNTKTVNNSYYLHVRISTLEFVDKRLVDPVNNNHSCIKNPHWHFSRR